MSEQKVADNWGWFVALGVLLIVLGLLALGDTVLVTIAVMLFCGIMFIFAAGAHLAHAFFHREWSGFLYELILSVLMALAGVFLFLRPEKGAIIYTLLLGAAFLFKGFVQVVLSFMHRRFLGWMGMLVGGVVSLLLGGLILANWPEASFFIVGLFVGIDLIMSGAGWVALGITASHHRTPQTQEQVPTPAV
jgi:uncharacterized membrane protein HdeD (DUF308 family)